MQVFISWSKPRAHAMAGLLRIWLQDVIQEVRPWVSDQDIAKGKRWSAELAAVLDTTKQGIICVTHENQHEPWLNFEAGALAKSLEEGRARTLLIDLSKGDLEGPLADLQATDAADREDMFLFVESINDFCSEPVPVDTLRRAFDRTWGEYHEQLESIRSMPSSDGRSPDSGPARSAEDMLSELLDRVRQLERQNSTRHVITTTAQDEQIRRARIWDIVSNSAVRHGVSNLTEQDGEPYNYRMVLEPGNDPNPLIQSVAASLPRDESVSIQFVSPDTGRSEQWTVNGTGLARVRDRSAS